MSRSAVQLCQGLPEKEDIDKTGSKSKSNPKQKSGSVAIQTKRTEVYRPKLLKELTSERNKERRKGHMKDALALGGDEGRDKLR